MHRKFAIFAADTLVSKHGLLFAIVASVHDEGQWVGVRMLFGSCYEPASVHGDKSSLNSQVAFIGKDQGASLNSNSLKDGCILVNIERGSLGHVDEVVVNRWHIDSPGQWIAPLQHIEEAVSQNGSTISNIDSESIVQIVGTGPGSNSTSDLRGSSGSYSTIHSINGDNCSCNVEVLSGQGQGVPAKNLSVPGADRSYNRSCVLPEFSSVGEGLSVESVFVYDVCLG